MVCGTCKSGEGVVSRGRYTQCAACNNEYNAKRRARYATDDLARSKIVEHSTKYRSENLELVKTRARERHLRLRDRVLADYGGRCTCCCEPNPRFLALHPIHTNPL